MALRFLVLAALVGCNGGKELSASKRSGIVSLSPALTDTIIALGAADQLVGISRYCTMPKGRILPRLGGVQDLPIEAIQSLRPSLVITSDSRHGPGEKLKQAGFNVEQFSEGSLNDVLETFSQLGAAIGRPEKGRQLSAQIKAELASLAAPLTLHSKSVLLVFSSQGEPVSQAWVAGPGGWLGNLVAHVGLINVLSEGLSYPQLSTEAIIELQPDVIVELHGQEQDAASPMSGRWGALKQLGAVKNGSLHRLSGEALLRPGPRLVELARSLAGMR